MCEGVTDGSCARGRYLTTLEERYQQEFGFVLHGRDVIVDDVRVRGIGESLVDQATAGLGEEGNSSDSPCSAQEVGIYFEGGSKSARMVELSSVREGDVIVGPALLVDKQSTILIEPGCEASVSGSRDISIKVGSLSRQGISTELDAIQLR